MIGIQIKINFLNEYLICIHVSSSKSNSDIIESGVNFFFVLSHYWEALLRQLFCNII